MSTFLPAVNFKAPVHMVKGTLASTTDTCMDGMMPGNFNIRGLSIAFIAFSSLVEMFLGIAWQNVRLFFEGLAFGVLSVVIAVLIWDVD